MGLVKNIITTGRIAKELIRRKKEKITITDVPAEPPKGSIPEESAPFQGPVRPGEDEEKFRQEGDLPPYVPPQNGGGGGGGRRTPEIITTITTPQTPEIITAIEEAKKGEIYSIEKQLTTIPKTQFRGGTSITPPEKKEYEVYTQPSLIQEQIGSIEGVPIVETYYIDPFGETLGGGASISTKRVATIEEKQYFKEQTNVLQASTEKRTKVDIIASKGRQIYTGYLGAEKVLSESLEFYGVTNERIKKGASILTAASPINLIPGGKEFTSSLVSSIVIDIKERPLASVTTLGIGAGFGIGKNILITGTTKVKPVLGGLFRGGVTLAEVGVGTYYGGQIAYKTISASSAEERGKIVGLGIKEATLFGVGYGAGYKGVEIVRGFKSTIGRKEIPLEKLTTKEIISGEDKFLLISKQKQLKAFRERRFAKELGEPQGGFHTTPQRFSKRELLEPQAGTSELPGLYISPGISPAFAKIPGKSSSSFNLPTLKDLFAPGNKPGVAFIKPKKFRVVDYEPTSKYFIDKQPFKYKFVKEPKAGYADLPLMKNEAEAILRPKTGKYVFESGKFYTEIEGVRVPIDVFRYKEGTGLNIPKVKSRGGRIRLKEFIEYEYRLPQKQSYSYKGGRYSKSFLSRYSSVTSQLSKQYSNLYSSSSYKKSYSKISNLYSSSSYRSIISNIKYPKSYLNIDKKIDLKFKEAKRKPQLAKQPTRYQASFTALSLNIRAKKAPKYAGGLALRPILD